MASSLAHSAARGAYFTLAAQAARILLQLLSVVVLARILSPHDYGLLAIVLVVVGLGEIFRDFGLTSASIQAPELSTGQRDNLFWINAAIGVLLTAIMYSLSWAIGAVTGEPDLVGISQWLALTFLLNGLATQHRANLMRDLKLRPLAVIDVASSAIALAVAIIAAVAGMGYWALVIQQLVTGAILLVGVVAAGRWWPRRYSRAHPVKQLVNFGWTLVATNLIGYASRQIDTVLISFRFGTAPLGLYNRAFQLIMTPLTQVRSPLQSVALPVLSRVQQDQPRFEAYVTAAQLALGFLFGIPVAIVAGLAEPAVDIMLGSRWAEAAPMLRMFAIAGILTTVSFVGYWVYLARGLGADLLRYSIVTALIKVVCVVIGSFFGVLGVAIAFAVHPAIAWPISLAWLSRITPMPRRQLYQGAGRIIAVSAAAGLAAWGVAQALAATDAWVQLGVGLAAGLAVSAVALTIPVYRRDAKTLASFVRLMLKRDGRSD
ncbi:lipopolysaccharide biosynthesis protein [Microbacterium foliorum]|uniref:Lipopolysaccharide biosynthesis protein WzxC n=1 Tax=Microbacterium foliorum TaxID=104336 RepID=A0A0F0KGP4_9MICO|nr:lipopolysaccharide biosynthesis protein [Microbacterium foliorum]AXL11167.1 lipopolysaccharide biosynthesis protein [Microbacterium foliorum]KJL19300.1 Lipopolysaccharide biosynthesis protein WzxC [Microbacterium foliorum]